MFKSIPIAGKWKMRINNYFDFNAKDELDSPNLDPTNLNSTILGMESDQGFILDLGWTPEGDINGNYQLELYSHDWQTIYLSYNSQDLFKIEQVLFMLLSIQPDELRKVITSHSLKEFLVYSNHTILMKTLLFSGWQMDVNVLYSLGDLENGALVYRCSQETKDIGVEISIVDSEFFTMKLIYMKWEVSVLSFRDHLTIPKEINRFMLYYLKNVNSQKIREYLEKYPQNKN